MTRVATYATHRHPDERDRVISTHEVTFDRSVVGLVQAAAALVPQWLPRSVYFGAMEDHLAFIVRFGTDDEGRSHYVSIQLLPEDVTPLVFDFARRGGANYIVHWNLPSDDQRRQKPKPKMSKRQLAVTDTPAMVL